EGGQGRPSTAEIHPDHRRRPDDEERRGQTDQGGHYRAGGDGGGGQSAPFDRGHIDVGQGAVVALVAQRGRREEQGGDGERGRSDPRDDRRHFVTDHPFGETGDEDDHRRQGGEKRHHRQS